MTLCSSSFQVQLLSVKHRKLLLRCPSCSHWCVPMSNWFLQRDNRFTVLKCSPPSPELIPSESRLRSEFPIQPPRKLARSGRPGNVTTSKSCTYQECKHGRSHEWFLTVGHLNRHHYSEREQGWVSQTDLFPWSLSGFCSAERRLRIRSFWESWLLRWDLLQLFMCARQKKREALAIPPNPV